MKIQYLIFIFLNLFYIPEIAQATTIPPKNNPQEPVEISITFDINKIYNINNVTETYTIDGYLTTTWFDKRLAFNSETQERKILLLENNSISDEERASIWIPTFQFMNTVEAPEIPHRALVIRKDGLIVYVERFTGNFTSHLNFRKYPFDTQEFIVQIESFSHNNQDVIFIEPRFLDEMTDDLGFDQWDIIQEKAFVSEHPHSFFGDVLGDSQSVHSRYNAVIIAKRKSHYFIWQIFIPLIIILLSSFTVLYDRDLNNQWAISFTLLLTVVAFNLYVAEHIPKLPYIIFIETFITSGYLLIFVEIIAILIQHTMIRKGREATASRFMKNCRWLFPLGSLFSLIILNLIFFNPKAINSSPTTRGNLVSEELLVRTDISQIAQ